MKKQGMLNSDISERIAKLGHMDRLVICDAGFPIPNETQRVDICVTKNIPPILDVIKVVLSEIVVEEAILAEEIKKVSPDMHERILGLLGNVPVRYIPHERFKQESGSSKAIIRTGEFTPYSSLQLVCGCAF